jgi:hypothetical protein
MGAVYMHEPPPCPDGRWCAACLMAVKQKQWEAFQDRIQAGYDKGGDEQTWIPFPSALAGELREGSFRAVCGEFPSLGVIEPLCWDHVAGINPTRAPAGLDVTTRVPPGLLKGKQR